MAPSTRANVYFMDAVMRYRAMPLDRLIEELIEMKKQSEAAMEQFNENKKTRFLPALLALKQQTERRGQRKPNPDRPNYSEALRKVGLTAAQVRQWKRRTSTEADMRQLLGEEPVKPKKKTLDDDKLRQALKDALRIFKAELTATTDAQRLDVERMKAAYIEKYGGTLT